MPMELPDALINDLKDALAPLKTAHLNPEEDHGVSLESLQAVSKSHSVELTAMEVFSLQSAQLIFGSGESETKLYLEF